MRALALILTFGSLVSCGQRLSTAEYNENQSLYGADENSVYAEVRTLPFKEVVWEYKFNNRPINRLTLGGDQLFIETPDNSVVAMDRFSGQTSWIFRIEKLSEYEKKHKINLADFLKKKEAKWDPSP